MAGCVRPMIASKSLSIFEGKISVQVVLGLDIQLKRSGIVPRPEFQYGAQDK